MADIRLKIYTGSYFNLSDKPTIAGTKAQICTRRYLPINANNIPTGTIDDFPIDVTKEFELQKAAPVIDNCFVLKSSTDPSKIPLDTRKHPLELLGSFHHPESGIHLEALSTEPAFQFYTGDHIDVPGKPSYGPRAGFCVEPGRFLNAVNQPTWRGMSLLKKGEVYGSKIMYEAWKV
jgi:aldose 1-epimerase